MPYRRPDERGFAADGRSGAVRIFGYDLFVSYAIGPSPRGTQIYAADLVRRLREADLTVFFEEEEPAGEELSTALVNALRHSRALVVIANHGTLLEPRWVRKEVEEFRRLHGAGRPVIPISVDGVLDSTGIAADAQSWLEFQGKKWLSESATAVWRGLASDEIIRQFSTMRARWRANVRWRWLIGTICLISVILVGSIVLGARYTSEQTSLALLDAAQRSEVEGHSDRALRLAILASRHSWLRPAWPDAELAVARIADESTLRTILVGHQGWVDDASFSPDETLIATASLDGTARIWNTMSGVSTTPAMEHGGAVISVRFNSKGTKIVTASLDGTARIWDVTTGLMVAPP